MAGKKKLRASFLTEINKKREKKFHDSVSYLGETGLCFPAGHNHLEKWKLGMKLF